MPSPAYNDGTVQYGSRLLVIKQQDYVSAGTPGTTYLTAVADNITVNRPTKAIDRTDQIGEPSGSVGVKDHENGSATLQLSSSAAKEPIIGHILPTDGTVNAFFDATIGSEVWYITSIARVEGKDAEKKFNVTFKKKYN